MRIQENKAQLQVTGRNPGSGAGTSGQLSETKSIRESKRKRSHSDLSWCPDLTQDFPTRSEINSLSSLSLFGLSFCPL